MIRLLEERARAGVDIRIIGRLTGQDPRLAVRKMPQLRLHTRTMVRDGRLAFIGSQSLRAARTGRAAGSGTVSSAIAQR